MDFYVALLSELHLILATGWIDDDDTLEISKYERGYKANA
jgi:hypothetical protein